MNRRERGAATKSSKAARNTATANTPAAFYAAGLEHFRTGQHLDAQIFCQQALAIDAEHADTLHLLGLLSLHAKQYDHALEWISRAIRREPKTDYLINLGTALLQQGDAKKLSRPSTRRCNSSRMTRTYRENSATSSPIWGALWTRS